MIDKLIQARVIRPHAEHASDSGSNSVLPLPLYAIQLILAYEWLLSGINKLADPDFTQQYSSVLHGDVLVSHYVWYRNLVDRVILPHVARLGPVVEVAELAIGTVLIVSAALVLWWPHWGITRYLAWCAALALCGSIVLALNDSLQQNAPLPWIDGGGSGVWIDVLAALVSVLLLVANLRVIQRLRRVQIRRQAAL